MTIVTPSFPPPSVPNVFMLVETKKKTERIHHQVLKEEVKT